MPLHKESQLFMGGVLGQSLTPDLLERGSQVVVQVVLEREPKLELFP